MVQRVIAGLGLLAWLCVLLAACSEVTPTPVPSPTPQPTSTATPAPTPTAVPAGTATGPEPPLVQKWQYTLPESEGVSRSLQLSPDQKVDYLLETVGEKKAALIAVDLTGGREKWRYDLSTYTSQNKYSTFRGFLLAETDTVYLELFNTFNGSLLALDAANGKQKWEFKAGSGQGFLGWPPVHLGEMIYAAFETPATVDLKNPPDQRTTYLFAINRQTGTKQWEYKATNQELVQKKIPTPPGTALLTGDQLLYLRGADYKYHAIELATGQERWKLEPTPGSTYYPLTGYKDGLLLGIFDTADPTKWRVRSVAAKDARTLWETTLNLNPHEFQAGGYIAPDKPVLYALATTLDFTSGTVYSLDLATGANQWSATDQAIYDPRDLTGNPYIIIGEKLVFIQDFVLNPGVIAIDRASGKISWQRVGPVYGMVLAKNTFYTITKDSLLGLDTVTGQEKWSVTLPTYNKPSFHLQATPDLVLVVLANGLLAYGKG